MKIEFIHIDGNDTAHNFTPYAPTQQEKDGWSRLAVAAYGARENRLGTRYSVAAALRHGETMPLERFRTLQETHRQWATFGTFNTDDPAQIVLPGAEKTTPREMLPRKAAARPIPKNGQEVLPAGGLFDPRGPLPTQPNLNLED